MASIFNMRGTSFGEFQIGVRGPKLVKKDGNAIQLSGFSASPELWLNGKLLLSADGSSFIDKTSYTGNAATSSRAASVDVSALDSTKAYRIPMVQDSATGQTLYAGAAFVFSNGALYLGDIKDSNKIITGDVLSSDYVHKTEVDETILGNKTFSGSTAFASITGTGSASFSGDGYFSGTHVGNSGEVWSDNSLGLLLNWRFGPTGAQDSYSSLKIGNGKGSEIASFSGGLTNAISLIGDTSITGVTTITGNTDVIGTLKENGSEVATRNYVLEKYVSSVTAATASGKSITVTKNGVDTDIAIPYSTKAGIADGLSHSFKVQQSGTDISSFDGSADKTINFQALKINGTRYVPASTNTSTDDLIIDITKVSSADTADMLKTAKKLWGNDFDGSKDVSGTIVPGTNDMYDVGTSTARFNNGYFKSLFSDKSSISTLNVSAVETSILPTGEHDIGSSSSQWKDAYFSGSIHGTSDVALKVSKDLTINLPDGSSLIYNGSNPTTLKLGDIINSLDPFEYKGNLFITADGNGNYILTTPAAANKGDVYFIKLSDSTYTGACYINSTTSGVQIEDGDMIVCNSDGTVSGETAKWDVVNKNITGAITSANFKDTLKSALYGSSYPETGNVAVFGTEGKLGSKAISDFVQLTGDQSISGTKTFSTTFKLGTYTFTAGTSAVELTGALKVSGGLTASSLSSTGNLILSGTNVYLGSADDSNAILKKSNLAITDNDSNSKTLTYFGNSWNFSINGHTHKSLVTQSSTITDLNTLTSAGLYDYAAGLTLTNAPAEAITSGFIIEVIPATGTSAAVTQRITSRHGVSYSRYYTGSSWTPWIATADAAKYVALTPATGATQKITTGNLQVGSSSVVSPTSVTSLNGIFSVNVATPKILDKASGGTSSLALASGTGTFNNLVSATGNKITSGSLIAYLSTTNFTLLNSTTSVFDFSMSAKTLTVGTLAFSFPSSAGTLALQSEVQAVSKNLSDNYTNNATLLRNDAKTGLLDSYLSKTEASNSTTGYTPIGSYTTLKTDFDTFSGDITEALKSKSNVGHSHYWLKPHVIDSTNDLNTIAYSVISGSNADETDDKTGLYYCNSSGTPAATNTPAALPSGSAFSLEVIRSNASASVTQTLTDNSTGRMYVRTGSTSNWGSWNAVVYPDDITNASTGYLKDYVKKAGDSMSGPLSMGSSAPLLLSLLRPNSSARPTGINFDHNYDTSHPGIGQFSIRYDLLNDTVTKANGYLSTGYVSTYMWDNSDGDDVQIFIPNTSGSNNGRIAVRFKDGASDWPVNTDTSSLAWKSIPYYSDILPITGGTMTGVLTLMPDANTPSGKGLNANGSNITGINTLLLNTSDDGSGIRGLISPRTDSPSRYDAFSLYNGEPYMTRSISSLDKSNRDSAVSTKKIVVNEDKEATISKILYSTSSTGPATYAQNAASNLAFQTPTQSLTIVSQTAGTLFNHTLTFPGGSTSVNNTYMFPNKSITIGDAADDVAAIYVLDTNKSDTKYTYNVSSKSVTIDLGNILGPYDSTKSLYACMKKNIAENIGAMKSFGAGITIGTDTESNIATDVPSYKSSGCTMKYDATEQCMRFTFA